MLDLMKYQGKFQVRAFALTTAVQLNRDLTEFLENNEGIDFGMMEIIYTHEAKPILLVQYSEEFSPKNIVAISISGSVQEINARIDRFSGGFDEDDMTGDALCAFAEKDTFILVEQYTDIMPEEEEGINITLHGQSGDTASIPFISTTVEMSEPPSSPVGPILHVTCGHADWEASSDEMNQIADMFQEAASTEGGIVVTRDGIHAKLVD